MAIQKLLLPYNFTRFDQKALDFVISAFAKIKNVEVTLFNAYTAVPEIETASTSVTSKLKESLSYLSQKITEQEAELKAIKQKLIENGFEDVSNRLLSTTSMTLLSAMMGNSVSGRLTVMVCCLATAVSSDTAVISRTKATRSIRARSNDSLPASTYWKLSIS